MATPATSAVYIQVIEDVISKIREEFINNGGPGEGALTELQALWELKMMQSGAIFGPIDRSSMQPTASAAITTPAHDLNTPMQTPLPGSRDTFYKEDEYDLVLSLFDEVTRTKSKRKCSLKDGVMHINGKDVLFHEATGEFDF